MNVEKIKNDLVNLAVSMGAADARVADQAALEGPPSADPTYVLPEAKAVIAFAVPLGKDWLPDYFGKVTRQVFRQVMYDQYQLLGKIGEALAARLEADGFRSVSLSPNSVYRKEYLKDNILVPEFSHRYAAVASGLGTFGWSGNVLVKNHWSAVLLDSVVTTAELNPDPPLPEGLCDNCRICARVCPWNFVKAKAKQNFTLGGHEYAYNAKGHHMRCGIVCAGLVGRSQSGSWSSWSPNPYPYEKNDDKLMEVMLHAITNPVTALVRRHVGFDEDGRDIWWRKEGLKSRKGVLARPFEDTHPTCCNCALICSGPIEWRKKLMQTLHSFGVVELSTDGQEIAVTPETTEEEPHVETTA